MNKLIYDFSFGNIFKVTKVSTIMFTFKLKKQPFLFLNENEILVYA